MNSSLRSIAAQFAGDQAVTAITPLGNGLINDTFRVDATGRAFVLQRINRQVFPEPESVIDNLRCLVRHVADKSPDDVQLQIPALLATHDRHWFYKDDAQDIWRALALISPTDSREQIRNAAEAEQVGWALGHFHRLCSDLPTGDLHDTLPGFHHTPLYYCDYQALLGQPLTVDNDADFHYCQAFIERHRHFIDTLEHAKRNGELCERVSHGDPKLNNFLFLSGSNRIVSLIDLDTVKPGLLHYDIGDCLRACCHDRRNHRFDLAIGRLILENYLREIGGAFSAADYHYLYAAIWLIPFELGLRFFSDYLAGNRYFKIQSPRHNLDRARAQFALCDSIASQRQAIEDLIVLLQKNQPPCYTD